jgi:hypothetical protein
LLAKPRKNGRAKFTAVLAAQGLSLARDWWKRTHSSRVSILSNIILHEFSFCRWQIEAICSPTQLTMNGASKLLLLSHKCAWRCCRSQDGG